MRPLSKPRPARGGSVVGRNGGPQARVGVGAPRANRQPEHEEHDGGGEREGGEPEACERHARSSLVTRSSRSASTAAAASAARSSESFTTPASTPLLARQNRRREVGRAQEQPLQVPLVLRSRIEPDYAHRNPEAAERERCARQALAVAGVVVEVADEQHRGPAELPLPDRVERELETGRDLRPGAERVRPRVRRHDERAARLRRAVEPLREGPQLGRRRPRRERKVRRVGEDDQAVAAAGAGELFERAGDPGVRVRRDARGEVEDDEAVGAGRQQNRHRRLAAGDHDDRDRCGHRGETQEDAERERPPCCGGNRVELAERDRGHRATSSAIASVASGSGSGLAHASRVACSAGGVSPSVAARRSSARLRSRGGRVADSRTRRNARRSRSTGASSARRKSSTATSAAASSASSAAAVSKSNDADPASSERQPQSARDRPASPPRPARA